MKNKNNKKTSMRRYITRYLLAITVLLALIYGVLMDVYLINGIKHEAAYDMELAAALFAKDYQTNPQTPVPQGWLFTSYLGIENVPEQYRKLFPDRPYQHREFRYTEVETDPEGEYPDFIILVIYTLPDGKQLFVVKTYLGEYEPLVPYVSIDLLFLMALPIGIVIVVIVFFAVRAMLQKLYRPVASLNNWVTEIDHLSLEQPVPDFGFDEVNQLAIQLHTNMVQLADTVKREERFLRNASHELRTPVAIIQSNIELLERLSVGDESPQTIPQQRIKRASINMSRLIETLLWLVKDEKRMPDSEPVALDALVEDLVDESRYLLENKEVNLQLNLHSQQVTVVAQAARITVANLIRNAFQYTAQGQVNITIDSGVITVTNINQSDDGTDSKGSDYGYGLGLVLVEQIAERSGWEYQNEAIDGGRRARIAFVAKL